MSKKRANGEGSIRRRPSGSWEGRYTLGIDPTTGKAIQKSISAKTQAECRAKLNRAIQENRGLPLHQHTGSYTVGEWCRLWFETYAEPNVRFNTAASYKNVIEHHIVPNLGMVKLKSLSSVQIQQMYNRLKTNGRLPRYKKPMPPGLSNSYIRRIHMVLRSALQQAVDERLINHNPCENCRIPPKEKKEMKIIPPEKVGAYLREAEVLGVLPIFYLELTSGLRKGELMALLWEDLDVEHRILSVNKQLVWVNGKLEITEPKTANSIRKVALPRQTVELLIQEHEKHPDNPILFPSPKTGGYWSPNGVSRINKLLLERAGIDTGVRFHDLRHTFATMAMQSGVDVKTLSSMLGHYSAGFTLDTYTHVTDQMQHGAAQKIGGFMEQATGSTTDPEPPTTPHAEKTKCEIIPFRRVV